MEKKLKMELTVNTIDFTSALYSIMETIDYKQLTADEIVEDLSNIDKDSVVLAIIALFSLHFLSKTVDEKYYKIRDW